MNYIREFSLDMDDHIIRMFFNRVSLLYFSCYLSFISQQITRRKYLLNDYYLILHMNMTFHKGGTKGDEC